MHLPDAAFGVCFSESAQTNYPLSSHGQLAHYESPAWPPLECGTLDDPRPDPCGAGFNAHMPQQSFSVEGAGWEQDGAPECALEPPDYIYGGRPDARSDCQSEAFAAPCLAGGGVGGGGGGGDGLARLGSWFQAVELSSPSSCDSPPDGCDSAACPSRDVPCDGSSPPHPPASLDSASPPGPHQGLAAAWAGGGPGWRSSWDPAQWWPPAV